MRKSHPPHTTYLSSWKENIDYIFYNPESMVVEKLLDMPEKKLLDEAVGIPNRHFPSDHLRIASDFKVFAKL